MFTEEQIAQFRMDTPGCRQRIHLNNAGAALMPRPVFEAIGNHIHLESEIGGYEAHAATADGIQGFYHAVAKLINAQSHQIAYMTSATDAYSRALSAINFDRDDVLLTTQNDYVSNQIAFIQLQKRFGVKIVRAADNTAGEVDVESVAELIDRHHPQSSCGDACSDECRSRSTRRGDWPIVPGKRDHLFGGRVPVGRPTGHRCGSHSM